jgi:hypothetical protein
MGTDIMKYFQREYYRSVEKRFDIKPIVYCWWFNFFVALSTFVLSIYIYSNMLLAIMHTFLAWTITLTISIVYWIMWIQHRIKGNQRIKYIASSSVIVMFLIALIFIFRTFTMVLRAINVS